MVIIMSKTIVIYHSYTGHTKMVADYIKEKLNCDILELKPKTPFSNDYQTVVDMYENNSINDKVIELEEININLDEYDEVILGSPVWWYTITPVIASFLKKYDLSKKEIYPFATNAGWIGSTFEDIKILCKNLGVKEGLNVLFSSQNEEMKMLTSYDEINSWLKI